MCITPRDFALCQTCKGTRQVRCPDCSPAPEKRAWRMPTIYYVDAINGNDANEGTSPATARRTVASLADASTPESRIMKAVRTGMECQSRRQFLRDHPSQFEIDEARNAHRFHLNKLRIDRVFDQSVSSDAYLKGYGLTKELEKESK